MLDKPQGAISPLGKLARKPVPPRMKIRECDLPLADLVEIGRRDSAAGGPTGFLGEDVRAIVLPREIEQAVREIGHQGAFVDEESRQHGVALLFQGPGLPPYLARIGHHAAANAQVRHGRDRHAGGQEVELDAAGGVAGVGAAVDLEDDGHRGGGSPQFLCHLGNKPAFAFIAEADADIGDDLAAERSKGHGSEGSQRFQTLLP